MNTSIEYSDLSILGMLGEGSFGHVQLVQNKKDACCYALKSLSKGQLIHDQQLDHVVQEKQLLAQCDSPFVLKLLTVFSNRRQVFLLTGFEPMKPL